MTPLEQIEAALAEMSAREAISRMSASKWSETSDLKRAIAALRDAVRHLNFDYDPNVAFEDVAKALTGKGEK
jgi:hypothetical protein